MVQAVFGKLGRTAHERPCADRLLYLIVLLVSLFLPSYSCGADLEGGQQAGASIKGELTYLGRTVWADAKSIARAPLEVGRVREITLRQALIGALVVGSIGGMIALDDDIRKGAKDMDRSAAAALQDTGTALSWAGLAALYGAGWWKDEPQWRHEAFTGAESVLVSFGLVKLTKVTFGRQRPDSGKGAKDWFSGGTSFISDAATPPFAMAEAVSESFDHAWWVTIPAYVAATAVGVGRMGKDRHWASDIVASALLGIGTTKLFTHMHHQREQAAPHVTFSPMITSDDTVGFRLTLRF